MIIHAKNVYIGGGEDVKKKSLLSRMLKKSGKKNLDNDMQDEGKGTPVMKKLSFIADSLRTANTHHAGGG